MKKLIIYRFLRVSSWIGGISFCYWAFADSRFRDLEGLLDGGFCLPFSAGMALLIFGWAAQKRWRQSAFWFALALVGQAVALQLIEAGSSIRYQHYTSLYSLFTDDWFYLIFLTVQTGFVFAGFRTRWSKIRRWLGLNFTVLQLVGIWLVFFLVSATVSKEISRYPVELFFATFVQVVNLGNIVLIAWALPEEILFSWKQKLDVFFSQSGKNGPSQSSRIDRFALLAALWVTVFASVLCFLSYQRHPHVPDEVLYLFQARYMVKGLLTIPAPPVPEAFSFYMIPYESQSWYSIFPPGWPAVLALGVQMGVTWLVNPVLAGLNILLTYILFKEIFDRRTARLAVLLLCFSPWHIFMAMSFMSHTFTLTCALVSAVTITYAKKTGKCLWSLLSGFSVGMVSLVRPLDGVIVAGILGLGAIGIGARRLKFSAVLSFIIGTIMVGAIIFPYNMQITGHPTSFPLTAYYEEYFGPKANALGFGPERGLRWAIDSFSGHSPFEALINANLNITSLNYELFGWSTGSLIIIALLLFSRKMRKSDYLMLIIILAIAATYSLYWFSGGPDFGARYWYLMLVPLIGLTVRGIQMLQEKFNFGEISSPNSKRVIVAVMALSLLSLINFFPWRAIDKYHHYRGMRPDIRELAKKHDFGKSLVLIRGDYSDYQSAWSYNPIDFKADAPIYAWDRNRDIRTQLLNAYPDRPVWIINGPSMTKTNFKVVEGPLFSQELLAR